MSEWKEYQLSEIVELVGGGTPKTTVPEYWGGNIPWLSVTDFNTEKKYCFDAEKKITEKGLNGSSTKILKRGQIIISARGTVGVLSVLGRDMAFNQSCYGIDAKKKFTINNFLYYLLKHNVASLHSASYGAVFDTITKETFSQIVVSIPPLPEQRAIASILSSLDDKIDLLHRLNQTLEAMAEALFRQWFVEEEEGWEENTLNDLCTQITSGGTPSTKIESYYNGDINWYSTKELKDNFLYESENKITKEGLENSSAKLFPAGTVVIAIYAAPTVGRLGILANEASFNQAACGLIANEEFCCSEFVYIYLKNQRDELNLMASGSAQQNLNVGKIKSYPAFKVPKDLMNKFKDAIQPNFKKINSNTLQIRTLEKLRDTLLPKLMSREVKVEMGSIKYEN
jgi:type I restriction enzyme S subunit